MGGMKKLRDQGNSTQNSRHSGLEGRAKVRPDARLQMPSKRATKRPPEQTGDRTFDGSVDKILAEGGARQRLQGGQLLQEKRN